MVVAHYYSKTVRSGFDGAVPRIIQALKEEEVLAF